MSRPTYIKIDLNKLRDNYETLKEVTGKSVMTVVKANAYGHGDLEIGKYLETLDTPFICVSSLEEAIRLSKHHITKDILIFSYTSAKDIQKYNKPNFVYTITSPQVCEEYKNAGIEARFHLEINTGMNRVGIKDIKSIKNIMNTFNIEGVYTHFQSVGDLTRSRQQSNLFNEYVNQLPYQPTWIHLGNAPVEIIKENELVNASRVGLGIYGYREDIPNLKPILSLYSEIIHIDDIKQGESIGYDETYVYPENGLFATMPIGYADGFLPYQKEVGIYIKNQPYSIVGKVCMDQTMIRVDETIQTGDRVEIIGNHRTIQDIVNYSNLNIYIILSNLSDRIRREYYYDNNLVSETSR